MRLKDKVAIITGAARGIGLAIARWFLARDWRVVLVDRDRDTLDARMKSVEQRYRKQFSALDTVLAGLQQTSAFLSQRLGSSNS